MLIFFKIEGSSFFTEIAKVKNKDSKSSKEKAKLFSLTGHKTESQ